MNSPRRRGHALLPGALLCLLVIASYGDAVFFGRIFAGRDPVGYHYPVEKSVHDAYSRGRLPVWMPEIGGGRPLLASPNVGALYPVRPLLSLVSFPTSLRLFPVIHWIGSGIGMLLLLRCLGVSPAGAWIGAVTLAFSAVSVSEVFYPNFHPGFTLMPWLVWTLARSSATLAGKAIPIGLVLGLNFLAGDVFAIILALLASVLWIALEVPRGGRIRSAGVFAAALGMAALIAAPQILGAILWVPETNRGVLGLKLKEILLFSVSPLRLFELVVPYPFGTTWEVDYTRIWGWPVFRYKAVGLFSGLYCGALAVIAVATSWRGNGSGRRFVQAFLIVTLGLCVLPSLIPAAWGDLPAPLPLRYPEKFATGFAFALSCLTGMGFDSLRNRTSLPRWLLVVGGLLALLGLTIFLMPRPSGELAVRLVGAEARNAKVAADRLPGALAEAGLLWMATLVALDLLARRTRLSLAASLAILTAVPILANRKIAQGWREENVLAPTAFSRWVTRSDPSGVYRVLGEASFRRPSRLENESLSWDIGQLELSRRTFEHYTGGLWGQSTIFNLDFDAGDFSRIESLRRISVQAAGFRDAEHFFGGLSLRWGIRYRDQQPYPGYRRVGGDALQDWDEHVAAYPDLRLVTRWREEEGALGALEVLPRLAPGEVVLETGARRAGRAGGGRLRILEKTPEILRFETASREPGWVFVLRSFWNHRTVRMDGREVPYVPAQLAFSAVPVPAGSHRFEWREDAPGWTVSRWGPPIAAGIAALLVWLGRLRRAS